MHSPVNITSLWTLFGKLYISRCYDYMQKHSAKHKTVSDATKLTIIRLIHTVIWLVFAVAILYVLYAGVFDRVNRMVWFCIGIVLIEGIVLLINKGRCPLTSLASKYTNAHPIGFDIFLPKWLAKYNKILFSTLFLIGLSFVLWRMV